jgi:hypothetical protein
VTAERYTAVFTGLLSAKKPGEYPYLSMSGDPLSPEVSTLLSRGRPPYERMGREIPFQDLPQVCQRLVLEAYRHLWSLEEQEVPVRPKISEGAV